MTRKSLSKSIRFEVFKRDKFTCQYCGGKAPDVVLHIDHVHPVSRGGKNDILNLVTSCYDCNLGKSDRKLDDNSVIEKQRKQLELIQERREQIELMFKWKKSLSNLDDETLKMIKEYVEAKIEPFTISEHGENNLRNHLRKYGVNEVLDAVDASAATYLKFSNTEGLLKESVERFLDKLGGVLFVRRLSPVEQKLMHIKNNAKKNLDDYNPRKASIILKEYVSALRNYWNYSDEQIINDLDNDLIPHLDKEYDWDDWTSFIESWIASIKTNAKKKIEETIDSNELQEDYEKPLQADRQIKKTKKELKEMLDDVHYDLEATMISLNYIMKPFPNYKEREFTTHLLEQLISFIEDSFKYTYDFSQEIKDRKFPLEAVIASYITDDKFYDFSKYDSANEKIEGWLLDKLNDASAHLMEELFKKFYFSKTKYSEDDIVFLKEKSLEYIKSAISGNRKKLKNRILTEPVFIDSTFKMTIS